MKGGKFEMRYLGTGGTLPEPEWVCPRLFVRSELILQKEAILEIKPNCDRHDVKIFQDDEKAQVSRASFSLRVNLSASL